jgi:hypothetical protein
MLLSFDFPFERRIGSNVVALVQQPEGLEMNPHRPNFLSRNRLLRTPCSGVPMKQNLSTIRRTKLYSGRLKVYPVSAMGPVQPVCAGLIFGGS